MKQRQVIIMITPPLPQMLDGITRYAKEHEWHLILANRFLRAPNGWNGDGAIVTLREDSETERFAKGLERRGIPFVDLTFRRPDIQAPRVLVDYESVGRIAAAHFADIGLRHAAWFSTVWSNVHSLMFSGFSKEWSARVGGKPLRMVLADSVARSRLDNIDRFAAVIGPKLSKLPKPAGILALNDDEASRILGLCLELGIQVPDELAILGIGNDTFICENQTVPLSSVVDSPWQRGHEGAALLDRLMAGAKPPEAPILIPCNEIVARRSTDTIAASSMAMRQALAILAEEFVNPPSAVLLAERIGVSRATLDRMFAHELRHSYRNEILRRRMTMAKTLLRDTHQSVHAIAAKCGFCNAGHFINTFRDVCGQTPSAWRRTTAQGSFARRG